MPDLIVIIHQGSYVAAVDRLDAEAIAFGDPALFEVFSERKNFHTFFAQSADVFVWAGGMVDADASDLERWTRLRHEVIHGAGTKQHIQIGAVVL